MGMRRRGGAVAGQGGAAGKGAGYEGWGGPQQSGRRQRDDHWGTIPSYDNFNYINFPTIPVTIT